MKDPIGEGKELYSAGRLHGEWPADELLARVEALRAFKESIPAKRKKMRSLLIIGIVAAIAFSILCAALPESARVIVGICAMGSIAGSILFGASIVMLIKLSVRKYDEDAVTVLAPLVRCVGPDMAKGAPFKVSASLKPPTAPDLMLRKSDKYSTDKYPSCYDRFFKRDILKLECRLTDKTRLQADIVEHTIEKVLSKKNARGKWKTKKKYRRKVAFRARLQLDEGSCRMTGEFKLPPETSVRVRQHPRGALVFLSLRKSFTDKQRLNAQPLLAVLAGAYQAFTPVQQNNPSPSGGVQ